MPHDLELVLVQNWHVLPLLNQLYQNIEQQEIIEIFSLSQLVFLGRLDHFELCVYHHRVGFGGLVALGADGVNVAALWRLHLNLFVGTLPGCYLLLPQTLKILMYSMVKIAFKLILHSL